MRCNASIARTLVIGTLLLAPASASAGPVEQLVQVALHPAQPELIALRYEYGGSGLLISRDGGGSFALLCSAGADPALQRLGVAAVSGDGKLLLGTFSGVLGDDGQGCGWTRDATLEGRWIVDVVAHPLDPSVSFALTSGTMPAANGIYRREGAQPFRPQGSSTPMLLTRLRFALLADAKLRIYQSAFELPEGASGPGEPPPAPVYVIRVSDDGGASYVEHVLGPSAGTVRLEAVDPSDPDRIVVSIAPAEGPTLLRVSDDAGASFRDYASVMRLGGLAITQTGRVFIGDAGNPSDPAAPRGLWSATSLAEPPALLNGEYPVSCLGYRPDDGALFACQRASFGRVDPSDGSLEPTLNLRNVERIVSCDDVDMRARCEAPLSAAYCGVSHFPCAPLCDAYGIDLEPLASLAERDESIAACLARRDGSRLAPMMPAAPPVPLDPQPAGDDAPGAGSAAPEPRAGPRGIGCSAAEPAARGRPSSLAISLAFALALVVLGRSRRAVLG